MTGLLAKIRILIPKEDKPVNKTKVETKKDAGVVMQDAIMDRLARDTTEIRVRLDKADVADKQADDHRLAAAITLAGVREIYDECKSDKSLDIPGISEGWHGYLIHVGIVSDARGRSYENIRRLVAVGRSDDPAAALADMRGDNARRKAKAYKEKKVAEEKKAVEEAPKPPVETKAVVPAEADKESDLPDVAEMKAFLDKYFEDGFLEELVELNLYLSGLVDEFTTKNSEELFESLTILDHESEEILGTPPDDDPLSLLDNPLLQLDNDDE